MSKMDQEITYGGGEELFSWTRLLAKVPWTRLLARRVLKFNLQFALITLSSGLLIAVVPNIFSSL